MRYQGGKFFQRKKIKEAIMKDLENREISGTYIEPFVGGGNFAEVMGNLFDNAHYSDTHIDLIMMWTAFYNGEVEIPETHITKEEYNELRHAEPSAYRGLIGFSCSFGSDWFKGFACTERHHKSTGCAVSASIRRITGDIITMAGKESTSFYCRDYRDISPSPGDVVYCDPPYAGTYGYSVGGFDTLTFWETMRRWTEMGAYVYVSEYSGPDDITVICEQSKLSKLSGMKHSKVETDKLYRVHS